MNSSSSIINRLHAGIEPIAIQLASIGRGRKKAISLAIDGFVALAAIWISVTLETGEAGSAVAEYSHLLIIAPLITLAIFELFGIYRWVVRSSNRRLHYRQVQASFLAALGVLIVTLVVGDPATLFAMFGLILLTGTIGLRSLWQGLFRTGNTGEPIAIYGAGSAGQQLLRLLSTDTDYRPVLLLDDNSAVHSSTIAGLPIYSGRRPDLKEVLTSFGVQRIVLAMPSTDTNSYREVYDRLRPLNIPTQTMPGIAELLSGAASPEEIRDVSISDILGRTEVNPNKSLLGRCVTGKTVLVTGGGGSIGSELCRQVMALSPEKLIVLDNSEANLYLITEELTSLALDYDYDRSIFDPILCSITDKEAIGRLFKRYGIDTVYHAAAYKHVPIVEAQPEQGVMVNVFGTQTVLDTAIEHGASHFVQISTDKAVRPTSSMGATKRAAELVLQSRHRVPGHSTCVSMVRFGNVLGSSGSVVPKFQKQIQSGGPVTITHPEITRYFMTIPEASQLVLQAGAVSTGGEVFVLDMGQPVKILDLAESMVRLYGKKLKSETGNDHDIEIIAEGLRPGEKMYEELFLANNFERTDVDKVFTADEGWMPLEQLQPRLDTLRDLAQNQERKELRKALLALAGVDDTPDYVTGRFSESVTPRFAEGPTTQRVPASTPGESRNNVIKGGFKRTVA